MQSNISAEHIGNAIWQYADRMRGSLSLNDFYPSVIYVLYGYHKQYELAEDSYQYFRFVENGYDNLLHDLQNQISNIHNIQNQLKWIYNEISTIPHDLFESVYSEVLSFLNNEISINVGRIYGEFYTPKEILSLISYFVNNESCQSVFDPFCGTATIVNYLSTPDRNIHFVGHDINRWSTLLARVVLDAVGLNSTIKCSDSITNWNESHFDAVISCPPLGLRLSEVQLRMLSNEDSDYRTLEDLLFKRSFRINNTRIVVTLESLGSTFRGQHQQLRKFLIDNNYLDMVISLPSNLLYGTSIQSVLFICKKNRYTGEPVKFIKADDCFIGEDRHKRILDVSRIISICGSESCDKKIYTDIRKIQENGYNLNPNLYSDINVELKDGQELVLLSNLITPLNSLREDESNLNIDSVTPALLSDNFIKVILNSNKSSGSEERIRSNGRYYFSTEYSNFLLAYDSPNSIKYGIRTINMPFRCTAPIKVYSVNESLVDPEYLVYTLLNNSVLNKGGMPLGGYMNHRLVIDKLDTQRSIIKKIKIEYAEKLKEERDAEVQRLGIKRTISDLEHMLAPTQFKINSIVARLERAIPGSDKYQEMVKSLKDNVSYMSRIIHYNNVEFAHESFNLKQADFIHFIRSYADAWNNYGGNYFTLSLVDTLDVINMMYDSTLLTVMFDSILSNAVSHGFHKKSNYTPNNMVEISWEKVAYQGSAYLCVKIANNGDSMKEDFGIEDYISKGRYSASTGRSGLGGNHVYQVVKGHNGFLFLDSNKQWNVIVEILLPINELSDNLVQYEHECI